MYKLYKTSRMNDNHGIFIVLYVLSSSQNSAFVRKRGMHVRVCVNGLNESLNKCFFSYGQHTSFSFTEQRALDGAERELRTLRKNLLHDAEAGELVLVIDGQSVKANPNATKTSNHLDCPPGMAQDHDAICCGKLLCHTE